MKNYKKILTIVLVVLFTNSFVMANTEVTGKLTYEGAVFTKSGSTIGDSGTSTTPNRGLSTYQGVQTTDTPSHSSGDSSKSEMKAQIFFDGDVSDSTFHIEVQDVFDSKAIDGYSSVKSYTQRDPLREAYIDSEYGDWSVRIGKQQVVWGTADGIKLLDLINPTDYSEMVQNQMEDSRITTWMINAEKDLENGGNIQIIVSQPKENIFAGINRYINTNVRGNDESMGATGGLFDETLNNGVDTGHSFTMKGPDTITGERNGFLNIVPDLGSVAGQFAYAFGGKGALGSSGMENFIVGNEGDASGTSFVSSTMEQMAGFMGGALSSGFQSAVNNVWNGLVSRMGSAEAVRDALGLDGAEAKYLKGSHMLKYGFGTLYNTKLADYATNSESTDYKKKNSAFEYMDKTTFRTFDTFVNAKSQYAYNMPKDTDLDVATRFNGSTQGGLNYSINASYNYDKNPIVNLSWKGDKGQELSTHKVVSANKNTSLQVYDPTLVNPAKDTFIATDTNGLYGGSGGSGAATLQFLQEVKRVKQLGGSFDAAIETKILGPIVFRGETLYTKDGYSPIMALDKLAIGDLVGSLQMRKADRFKYVLGADITLLKNMLISAQFIQDRNLDYVDDDSGYTADYSTMSLSNGFHKSEKNKEFYSLFFSKPFGLSGEHRWNNIFMFEENGGKWNRLDAEFSINDNMQVTIEYNKYWGDESTQFGQLKNSSNVQTGIKYLF